MGMSFRWFGAQDAPIPLQYIRQIPGVRDVVGALYDVPVGEAWPEDKIGSLKRQVVAAGISLEVIESANIHDDIKIGLPSRDRYIDDYRETIRRLGALGISVMCYNFMPVFDWLRTELWYERARSIDVCNFKPRHVRRLIVETGRAPTVNQLQIDPRGDAEIRQGLRNRHRGVEPARARIAVSDDPSVGR